MFQNETLSQEVIMEKLSSILPKSPRTQNVDNSKAQPARPGAPLLGRPMGRVTQKVIFDDAANEVAAKPALDLSFADKFSVELPTDKVSLSEGGINDTKLSNYTRKGDLHKVKIAEDVGRKFAQIDAKPKIDELPETLQVVDTETEMTDLAAS